jgi:uncharacterized membrane protein
VTILLDIQTFFGHLHPILVHLPIGFLLLAVLFQLLSYVKKFQHLATSVPIILLLGFVAACSASLSGLALSQTGDYDHQQLTNHKFGGFAVAIVSGVLCLMTTSHFKRRFQLNKKIESSISILLLIVVTYTGHQGGNLTHGSDYLSLEILVNEKLKKPTSVDEALLYEQVIQPILLNRCSQCHRQDKRKGKLSMQSIAELMKGGKTGPAVVAGKLNESELYKRITLDPSDEKFMPTDGKPPLTKAETAIIKWWIEKGNLVEGKTIAELKDAGEIKPEIASYLGFINSIADAAHAESVQDAVNPEIPATLNMTLVDSLRSEGVNVRVMLHNPVMLDVTLPAGSGIEIASIKSDLIAVAKNVIWLNVSDNNLKVSDLDFLSVMTNLEKLRLEKNPIEDGIAELLLGLNHLEAVNLNETRITMKSLEQLNRLPKLKRVYSWESVVEK